MMILPLADALQNCLQDLTSRIAGVDNEQMAGRAMGMGAMLGYSVGAVKEQFNNSNNNAKSVSSNGDNSGGGLQGFISRAKSVINPSMNLSSEKDYNGNVNPIRDVVPKEKSTNAVTIPTSNGTNKENMSNGYNTPKSAIGKVAKVGFNATKTYVGIGAKMAEGDFSKSPYKANTHTKRKNNFQNTEYINNIANNNSMQKLGDENGLKEQS